MTQASKTYLEKQLSYIYSLKQRTDIPNDNLKLMWALKDEERILTLLSQA